MSRITDAITSPTTSGPRNRSRLPPTPPREPSCSPLAAAPLHARIAGITPKPIPVRHVSKAASATKRRSKAGSAEIGRELGTNITSSGAALMAISTLSAPPAKAKTRLSVRSWRTRRSRPAPMAERTASSLRRISARANSRFARFVHAINSTHSAAPSKALSNIRERSEMSRSRSPVTRTFTSSFSLGYWRCNCAPIHPISACACSFDTPRPSLATT